MNRYFPALSLLVLTVLLIAASSARSQTHISFDSKGDVVGIWSEAQRQTMADQLGAMNRNSGKMPVKTPSGATIPVPIETKVPIPKAAAAKAAAKRAAAAAAGPIGAGLMTAAEVATLLQDQKYQRCPDGQEWNFKFLCKKVDDYAADKLYRYCTSSPLCTNTHPPDACQGWMSASAAQSYTMGGSSSSPSCTIQYSDGSTATRQPTILWRCYNENNRITEDPSTCVGGSEKLVPAEEAELELTLQQKLDAEYEATRKLVDAMRADQEAAESAGQTYPPDHNPVKPNSPVEITAPPVSGPERVVKTTETPKPDGSVDTNVERQKEVVTPETSGTGVGDSKITFPTQTIITNTTTNNVTNNTTTTTTTINHPAPEPSEETPPEEEEGICKMFPDILACKKLEQPEEGTLDKTTKNVECGVESVAWAGSGCPAPVSIGAVAGEARSLEFEPFCDVATRIKPFILFGAAASAIFIVFLALKV